MTPVKKTTEIRNDPVNPNRLFTGFCARSGQGPPNKPGRQQEQTTLPELLAGDRQRQERKHRYCFWLYPFLLGGLFWQSADAIQEHWQQPEFLLNSFVEIALKNEYETHTGRVRKWSSPVKVWIDHRAGEKNLHHQLVRLHLEDLARITGHPISLVASRKKANVVLVFARFTDMANLTRRLMGEKPVSILPGTLCIANIRVNRNQAIHHASIIIPADQATSQGRLVGCVVEELTQILGLVNDSEAVYPSIFNDVTLNDLLTGLDYLLLRILYDSRVQPGMQTVEVKAIVRTVIKEMTARGEVANAWRLANESGLYFLLEH